MRFHKKIGLVGSLAVALLAAMLAQAAALTQSAQFDIEPQHLDTALLKFSKQSGISVSAPTTSLSGKMSAGVSGELVVEQALKTLLEGTGLTYKMMNDHTVAVGVRSETQADNEPLEEEMRLAQADTQEPNTSAAEVGPQDAKLEEIVVTAQKRQQNIKEVPLSITAISGEDLESRDIDNASGLSFFVPSLTVREIGSGRQEIVIRGIGSGRGTSSLTGVYLDEIPTSGAQDGFIPAYLDLRTIDLERVEVLKGPQGTLFGEGAVGGVIRYVTKDPQLNEFSGRVSGTFYNSEDGGFSEEAAAIINAPLVKDVFGIRIAAIYEDKAGWIDNVPTGENDFNDNNIKNVRVKSLWQPTPELAIKGLVNVHRNDGGGSNIVDLLPYENSRFRQAFDVNAPTGYSDEYEIYNLTATYDLKFAQFLSSTSYYESDSVYSYTQFVDGTPVPIVEALSRDYTLGSSTASQELRLTSTGRSPLRWVVGSSFKKSDIDAVNVSGADFMFTGFVLARADGAGRVATNKSEAWAGFADASYLFADRLEIGGGIRYFSDDRENFESTATTRTPVSTASFDAWTYRAFVRYNVADNVNVYANVGDGFRSGGFNVPSLIAAGAPPTYQPETALFYEVGAKTTWFDRRFGLDIALFKGTYSDRLENISRVSPVTNRPIGYTVNAGEAEIEGYEWLLNWAPIERMLITLSGDVIDAKLTKVGDTLPRPLDVGDRINNVPKYTVTFGVSHGFDWSDRIPGTVDVSFSRHGESTFTIRRNGFAPDQDFIDPVDFLQASIGAEWNGFQLSLFGRNLLDERNPISPSVSGTRPQARPRTVGITVGKAF